MEVTHNIRATLDALHKLEELENCMTFLKDPLQDKLAELKELIFDELMKDCLEITSTKEKE